MSKSITAINQFGISPDIDGISLLKGKVTNTVTLGSAAYAPSLTIAASGHVAPILGSAGAVYMPANIATDLTNDGKITGRRAAHAAADRNGGYGVLSKYNDTITNNNLITGGAGANIFEDHAGNGGVGIDLTAGGTLNNSGTIQGGAGGYGRSHYKPASGFYYGTTTYGFGGLGGTGVVLAGSVVVSNTGLILGGAGGKGAQSVAVSGGAGISMSGGTLTNAGTLQGGAGGEGTSSNGGGEGGDGLDISGGAATNQGNLQGGVGGINGGNPIYNGPHAYAGGNGASVSGTGMLTNDGVIMGAGAGSGEGASGTGVVLTGGSLLNDGLIQGGTEDGGGLGVEVQSASVLNNGTIFGGSGNFGGTGAALLSNGILINQGLIAGAPGGYFPDGVDLGGQGVEIYGNGTLVNFGTVAGGGPSDMEFGIGIEINDDSQTAIVANYGLIIGGAAGSLSAGADGVYLNGGTLINAGTIAGGAASATKPLGDAVAFGSGNDSVLVLDPGASFIGAVAGNTMASDTLELAGAGVGTFTGLGTEFTGFSSVIVEAGADWDVTGTNTGKSGNFVTSFIVDGTADITGTLVLPRLEINTSGVLELGSIALSASLANAGTVLATTGTAMLGGAVSGDGVLAAQSGATLEITAAQTTAATLAGAGTILFDAPVSFEPGAALTAASVTAGKNVTLGGDILSSSGTNFTLGQASGGVVQLTGPSGSTFTNAGTLNAVSGGAANIAVAFINQGNVSFTSPKMQFMGGITNNGVIDGNTGLLSFSNEVLGTGELALGAAGTLSLAQGAAAGQTVQFAAATGLLDLSLPAMFAGAISGFGGSDKIDLISTAVTGFSYANQKLSLQNGQTTVATLNFNGSYSPSSFAIASDSHGGTLLKFA